MIHRNHRYRPRTFNRYGDGVMAGVELEASFGDLGRGNDESPYLIRFSDQIDAELPAIYTKRDGSVVNGVEFVTHPAGLEYHRTLWRDFFARPEAREIVNSASTGTHVHIERRSLTAFSIARMVLFINSPETADLVDYVAMRTGNRFCVKRLKTPETALYSTDRREALNITGADTVEFRIFKGAVNYEEIMIFIEFSFALTRYCTWRKTQLDSARFIAWVTRFSDTYPNLQSHLSNYVPPDR